MKTKMIQTIKKHKYLSLFILIIFLFLFVMIIIRGYHNCQPMLVLKKDVFEVEYGHPISQNPLDYVKINEYKEKKKEPHKREETLVGSSGFVSYILLGAISFIVFIGLLYLFVK